MVLSEVEVGVGMGSQNHVIRGMKTKQCYLLPGEMSAHTVRQSQGRTLKALTISANQTL